MRVLFDSQAFDMQTIGGVSRCFVELYRHLPKEVNATIGVLESNNIYLRNLGYPYRGQLYDEFICKKPFRGKGRLFNWYNSIIGRKYWGNQYNRTYCKKLLQDNRVDVFHPTYFGDWFLSYLGNIPFVLTIHDMIPERFFQYFKIDDFQILMKRKLAPLASKIIAVSENTKNDVVQILKVPEDKVEVIYHGVNSLDNNPSNKSLYVFPYLLYVGSRYEYKNFIPFLRSCKKIFNKYKDLKLICTGAAFTPCELTQIESFGLSSRIIHRFVKTDEELMNLYHHAVCFVYPSLYEGFGIPILEAYQAQCPVLLNRRSCFPEIAGDAAIYFDMDSDTSDFAEVFEDFYNSYSYIKDELILKQNKRLKQYSWERSAQQLADVYQSII